MRTTLTSALVSFFLLLFSSMTFAQGWPCEEENMVHALQVDNFLKPLTGSNASLRADLAQSILGDLEKENALLFYATSNKFNQLTLFGTELIFAQGDSSYNGMVYRSMLADFVARADSQGINIGLGFDANLANFSEPLQMQSKEISQARGNIKSAEVEGLSQFVDGIKAFNRELKSPSLRNGHKSILGIDAVQARMYWWEHPAQVADSLFDNVLIPTLRALKTLKDSAVINRIETCQGVYPYLSQPNAPGSQAELNTFYYKWAAQIMSFSDRIVMSDPVSDPAMLGKGTELDLMLSIYKGEVEAAEKNVEFVGLFNAQSNKFYNTRLARAYGKTLGDSLARGGANGESIQEVQAKYKTSITQGGYEGTYFAFSGYQWSSYSTMPLMIYQAGGSGKIVNDTLLSDNLLSFYGQTDSVLLEVFNTERAIGAGNLDSARDGNNYIWYGARNLKAGTRSVVISNVNTPFYKIKAGNAAVYYVESKDSMGCSTFSVPARLKFYDRSLWMKDFDDIADLGEEPNPVAGDAWSSPDIWVNPSSNPKDLRNVGIVSDTSNYVHIRVRNKSTTVSTGTDKLEVYFLHKRLNTSWPSAWHNNVANLNDSLGSRILGDRVNTMSVNIPAIPAGKDTIIVVKWAKEFIPAVGDSVANPQSDPDRKYNILARILRNDIPGDFGMKFKELPSVAYNMISNNTISGTEVVLFNKKEVTLTAISEQQSLNFQLFPNPSTGLFNLRIAEPQSKIEYSLYNTSGKLVLKGIEFLSNTNLHLDFTTLSSGTYFLKLQGDKFVGTRKLSILSK